MPATLTHVIDIYANTPTRRPALVFASAGLLLGAAVWSTVGTVQASSTQSTIQPLYPQTAPVISIVDVPNLTVLQVIRTLPVASRFDTLLSNTGVRRQLTGTGPYTVFAPANNYFDYLPRGAYISLTRAEEQTLAEHLVVSNAAIDTTSDAGSYVTLAQDQIPVEMQGGAVMIGNGFAVRGYRASNGIVYVVNKVFAPDTLADALGGK